MTLGAQEAQRNGVIKNVTQWRGDCTTNRKNDLPCEAVRGIVQERWLMCPKISGLGDAGRMSSTMQANGSLQQDVLVHITFNSQRA